MANYKRKRKTTKRNVKSSARIPLWLWILGIGLLVFLIGCPAQKKNNFSASDSGCEAAIGNYGDEIKRLSKKYDISKDYLMALIMLECSGRRDVPPRFEKGVYNKLVEVQKGNRTLEGITEAEIHDASDLALRNLASSWGPFQLMGYKCLHLNIQIKDLRGENSLEHGVRWINATYGDYLRAQKFEDAFHIHNTGHAVPKGGKYQTYDPNYVPNGMNFMRYFKENM